MTVRRPFTKLDLHHHLRLDPDTVFISSRVKASTIVLAVISSSTHSSTSPFIYLQDCAFFKKDLFGLFQLPCLQR